MPQPEEKKTVENADAAEIHKAREGLLQALQRNLAPKFSSTPIAVLKNTEGSSGEVDATVPTNTSKTAATAATGPAAAAAADPFQTVAGSSVLTESEKLYLEALLQSNDPALLLTASQTLSDATLFPPPVDTPVKGGESGQSSSEHPQQQQQQEQQQQQPQDTDETAGAHGRPPPLPSNPRQPRRNSGLQQQLFRLHEMTNASAKPSQVLQRMSFMSHRNNSILAGDDDALGGSVGADLSAAGSEDLDLDESEEPQEQELEDFGVVEWNPFKDISSWLDGSQGIEVSDNGIPTPTEASRTKARSFKILGTSANDVSCHPHVLSPPAMESLTSFMPESLSEHNFWLKYSLVRDGASLWKMLRQVRASTNSLLAIETTDGDVFGAFTTQTWRYSQGWYGSKESFLWKMRNARSFETTTQSIVEQACQEGEIQVFPYRAGNVAVQYCSKEYLMLGQGELLPSTKPGQHYGYGLYLEADLLKGSTSTSETFGNPCMVAAEQRGARFDVANIEVWTFTPHATVEEAVQSELSTLFLEGGRNANDKKLNLLGILAGGPI